MKDNNIMLIVFVALFIGVIVGIIIYLKLRVSQNRIIAGNDSSI
jgi:uncharacterized protein YneF (UPF0154 family)